MSFLQPYQYPDSLAIDQGPNTTDEIAPDVASTRLFRILTLLPGGHDDDVYVELRRSHLLDKGKPTYEVLSYVWGSMENPVTIYIGREKKYTLAVTRNLAAALRYLRYSDRSRTLWIDAICINQLDIAERSSQVRIMADIYHLATKATVWLGPVENDSDRAIKLLADLSSKVHHPDRFGPDVAISESDQSWNDLLHLPHAHRDLQALGCLINRDWFERLWIRQEIFHTSEMATIQCGHQQISWKAFRNAVWLLRYSPQGHDEYRKWYEAQEERFRLLLRLFYRSPLSLRWLRDNFRGSKCSDQRDRIYATLSLLFPEEQELGIVPDYSLSVLEVFRDAVARYIQSLQTLSILRDIVPSQASQQPEWPSWVPDWSVTTDTKAPDFIVFASGPLKGYATYIDRNTLRVAGVRIGVVEEVWSLPDKDCLDRLVSRFIRDSVPQGSGEQPYVGGGSLLEAYAFVLTEGEIEESFYGAISTWYASMDEVIGLIKSTYSMSDDETERQEPETNLRGVLRVIGNVLRHRAIFKTEDGYIGVGPKRTVRGDHVCVFSGCELPMILRAPGNSQQYRIVGGSFVHGYASGEALLGGLPDHYRFVTFHATKPDLALPGYLNTRNGIVQKADPRVLSLPIDVEDYIWRCRRIGVAGVDVSPDVLKGLGVNVMYFNLV